MKAISAAKKPAHARRKRRRRWLPDDNFARPTKDRRGPKSRARCRLISTCIAMPPCARCCSIHPGVAFRLMVAHAIVGIAVILAGHGSEPQHTQDRGHRREPCRQPGRKQKFKERREGGDSRLARPVPSTSDDDRHHRERRCLCRDFALFVPGYAGAERRRGAAGSRPSL